MGQGASGSHGRAAAIGRRRAGGRKVTPVDGTRAVERPQPTGQRPAAGADDSVLAPAFGAPALEQEPSMDPAILAPTVVPDAHRLPRRLDPGRRRSWLGSSAGRTCGPIGSGRTGGTNALRALGRKWAAVVVDGRPAQGRHPGPAGPGRHAAIRWSRSCAAARPWPARSGSVFAGFRSGRGVGTGRRHDARDPARRRPARDAGVRGRHPADPLRVARVAAGLGRDVPGDAAGPDGRPGDAAPVRASTRRSGPR